jgi:hypothetical protein
MWIPEARLDEVADLARLQGERRRPRMGFTMARRPNQPRSPPRLRGAGIVRSAIFAASPKSAPAWIFASSSARPSWPRPRS